ncbi:MAG TPA: S8 family serine peptidase, partial [Abditibacterium sp.]
EKAGILNICAAGNGGVNTDSQPEYPASYPLSSIVSVAASDASDARPGFSNYGAQSVDLAAPGTSITSLGRGGGTSEMSGTSMATPIVAGAAALLLAREGSLSASALKDRLLKTVDPIAAWNGLSVSGGRLNLARALSNAVLKMSGQVYRPEGTSRIGLAGAFIKVNNKIVTSTDQNGRYSLSDLAPGKYSVTASLSGYTFATSSVALPRASGQAGAPNAVVDFAAKRAPSVRYSIAGTTFGTDGQPKSGVSIFISGVPGAVAFSDASGNYSLRDRASGTYQLSASDGIDAWRADPTSVALPSSGKTGAPNGIVNFYAAAADKSAPQITIRTPQNGATLPPGSLSATGTAFDPSGVKQIYFQLARIIDFSLAYYDWTTQTWTFDANAPGIKGVQSVSGTNVNWSQTLPNLGAASYSLRVWGADTLGNESKGEADAVTSWNVQSSSAAKSSAKPSAGSS